MKKIIRVPHYELRCPYCSCHFSFDNEDIRKSCGYNTSEKDKKRHVTCPHCKEDIIVENEKKQLLAANSESEVQIMKSVLLSVKPQHVANILNGLKTIEIRKKFPSDYVGWVYIYCTKGKYEMGKFRNDNLYHEIRNDCTYACGCTWNLPIEMLNGKVVARFWCNKVETIHSYLEPEQWYMTSDLGGSGLLEKSCLSFKELDDYLLSGEGYAIHITKLEIFDKPKEISELYKVGYSHKLKFALNTQNKVFREQRVADVQYDYKLTHAPQSWQFIEV